MHNHVFCCGMFYSRCAALIGGHGCYLPISWREVSIRAIRPYTVKHAVAFAQGTRVPVFNGSPPL